MSITRIRTIPSFLGLITTDVLPIMGFCKTETNFSLTGEEMTSSMPVVTWDKVNSNAVS